MAKAYPPTQITDRFDGGGGVATITL